MVSFSSVKNYLAKKAEDIKKAVVGEDESTTKKAEKKNPSTTNVPLVSDEALKQDDNMGLSVQKTATAQSQTKSASQQTEAAQTQTKAPEEAGKTSTYKIAKDISSVGSIAKNTAEYSNNITKSFRAIKAGQSGQVFDEDFVIKNAGHGLTREKWDKMSDEEKELAAGRFMNEMITNWNRDPKNKDKQTSVEQQYQLYMSRCKTKEDVEFLTRTFKHLDTDRRLSAFIQAHQYENAEFQEIAENILADNMDCLAPEDQEAAHEHVQQNFHSSDAKAKASVAATKITDVEVAHRVTRGYQDLKDEKVDIAMSNHIGEYFRDENGEIKPGSQAEKYQMELWQNGLQNASSEEARTNYARNTYQLTRDNQTPASDIVIATNNEAYLNAMAENVYKFDESTRDNVINNLENSGYESVHNTLQQARANYEAEQAQKAQENDDSPSVESNDKSDSDSISSSRAASQRVNNIINNKSINTAQKAKEIKTLAPKEQKEVISQLLEKATLPEIKGYVLSGLKTEVINYLLDNYSAQNSSALKELEPMMSQNEKERFDRLTKEISGEVQKNNFFIH